MVAIPNGRCRWFEFLIFPYDKLCRESRGKKEGETKRKNTAVSKAPRGKLFFIDTRRLDTTRRKKERKRREKRRNHPFPKISSIKLPKPAPRY